MHQSCGHVACDEKPNPHIGHPVNMRQDYVMLTKLIVPPRITGFLRMKNPRSRSFFPGFNWKERFFFLVDDGESISLFYIREPNGSMTKVNVDMTKPAISIPCKSERFCFHITDDRSERITLAATSELQMRLWISCLTA